jgi:hypothetical protein
MKTYFVLLSLLFFIFSLNARKSEIDSLFSVLDHVLENREVYVQQKEKQIAGYKQLFDIQNLSLEQQYDINLKLFETYISFKLDSAIVYMQRNVHVAEKLKNDTLFIDSKLRLSSSYSMAGFFVDALNLLNSIDREKLGQHLLLQYYRTYARLYFSHPSGFHQKKQHALYRDSVLMLLKTNSTTYKMSMCGKLIDEGQCENARNYIMDLYKKAKPGSHWQAMVANSIGKTYRGEQNYEMQKKYFAIAAIGDVKNAVKENESFRSLAIACYGSGDITRAYKYIYQSIEDALFANVNLRMTEASLIFPIIEKSHKQKKEAQQNRLYVLLVFIGVLSVILIISVIYISIQMKNLKRMQYALSQANSQLGELNEILKKSNEEKNIANNEVILINKELSEANLLKETYISQFLTICSVYIKKLEKYQKSLNKKAFGGHINELYEMLKSRNMIENEIKELYNLFDTVFLKLYPNFMEKFNDLLPEEESFHLKTNKMLNIELRIFALIRLGINDSSQIADFLHCSLATIYNYRTRVKNKSFIPKDFEKNIMKIGKLQ